MMRKIFYLALLLLSQVAFAGIFMEPVVISQADLAEKGIKVRKIAESSPLPTYRIEVEIRIRSGSGTYESCELVVLDRLVYPETLRDIEFYLRDKAVWTVFSKETKKSFTIFGKEADRAYVAIVVLVGFDRMAIFDRYLLPTSAMKEEKDEAIQSAESTPSAGTSAAEQPRVPASAGSQL